MALLLFAYVDPANQSAAEAEVPEGWFAGIRARLKLNTTVKGYTKVCAFEKEQLHYVRELYKRISLQYGAEARTAIGALEREKQVLQTRLAAKEQVMATKDAVHAEVIAAKDAVIEVQSM
jgi:DNA gyrase/topoisomerase IV subunit A